MSESHTPGPWTFSRWDGHGYTRFYIAQQEGAPYTPDYSDVASLVAETCSGERVVVQEANARLLAAAPDLLEAMQLLVIRCKQELADPEDCHEYCAALNTIAKATGA